MKAGGVCALTLLFVCYIDCRKTYVPIDKNANLAFINMEGGGGVRPGSNTKPQPPTPSPINGPAPAVTKSPAVPVQPITTKLPIAPTTVKPAQPTPTAVKPTPAKPSQGQGPIQPKPVNPPPASNPITTPGPGSVKQLINFYDSQGKASQIRPYSYSQAVKQG